MAEIYHGRGAVIGFAEESTWGTAIAAGSINNYRPLVSSNLLRTIEKVPRPHLQVGTAGAIRRSHYIQNDNAGGTFVVEASYSSIGMLLKHLMGSVAKTGTGPFTHTFTLADDVPTGLTMANIRGTGTCETFEGCRITQGTFNVAAGGVMTAEFEVIAETSSARASYGGTVAISATDAPILHSHAGQLSFNGTNYDLVDLTLTVNNALSVRQHLGSAATKKPLRSDFGSVELALTLEVSDTAYAAFTADSVGDAEITFTSGADAFQIALHNAYMSEASDPVSDANVIQQSITLVGQSDGTDHGVRITTVNGNSSSTAN